MNVPELAVILGGVTLFGLVGAALALAERFLG